MKTHTLGPWVVLEPYTDRQVFPIAYRRSDGAMGIIAEVNSQGGVYPVECNRNATLMAASPDLLAACQFALAWIQEMKAAHPGVVHPRGWGQLELINAIEKATK